MPRSRNSSPLLGNHPIPHACSQWHAVQPENNICTINAGPPGLSLCYMPAPTPALAPIPCRLLAKLRTENLWEGGNGKEAKHYKKRKPDKPKACRWKGGGCPTVPRRRSNAVGRCNQILLLCVVIAARRSTLPVVDAEVLCSVSPRERVGQFFVGRVTAGGRRDGGRRRVLFWKGEVEHAVDWKSCSCFSLCAGVFSAPSWSCAVLRCFPRFPESKSRYRVQTSKCGIPG